MMSAEGFPDQNRFEMWMAFLLRSGVILAATFVLIGALMVFAHPPAVPDYKVFHGEAKSLCSYAGIVKEVLSFNGLGIIQFGVLLLILTPVARVAASIALFVWERDYLYVSVTLVVLGALLWGLVV